MIKFLIIFFLISESIAEHEITRKKRVVGGFETVIIKHPHQVSLRSKVNGSFYFVHHCGGTIYSPWIIITAAHCVHKKKPSQIMVVAGSSYRIGSDGIISGIKKFLVHELFDYDHLKYDIAILHLGAELPIDNFTIESIQLANKRPPVGALATISGWGKTSEDADDYSYILREVQLPIISNNDCKKMYPDIDINKAMICAGVPQGGIDGCQGDSGGGFVYKKQLVGITSFGKGCAQKKSPAVFTSIPNLRGWIEEHVKILTKLST